MAVVTEVIAAVGSSFIELTYDDETLVLGEARAVVVDEPVRLRIQRGNGNAFRNLVLDPGEHTISFPAGNVRDLNDIPFWGLVS